MINFLLGIGKPSLDDKPRLAENIIQKQNIIIDESLNRSFEINSMGMNMIKRMDGRKSIKSIAKNIANEYDVEYKKVKEDILALSQYLYKYDVIHFNFYNFLFEGKLFLKIFKYLFMTRRKDIKSTKFIKIILEICFLFFPDLWFIYLFMGMIGLSFYIVSGDILPVLILFGLTLVLNISFVLHEGIHLYILRRLTGNSIIGFVRITFNRIQIVRPYDDSPEINFLVAISSSVLLTFIGVGLYCLYIIFQYSFLIIIALVFLIHSISILPLFSFDGRHAYQAYIKTRNSKK